MRRFLINGQRAWTLGSRTASGNSEKWSLKEVTVFIPAMTTALAIAWQVGRFQSFGGYGGFTYFSLTDHLVAAAEALPLAFIFSSVVCIVLFNNSVAVKSSNRNLTSWTIAESVVALILVNGLLFSVARYGGLLFVLSGTVINLGILTLAAREIWPAIFPRGSLGFLLFFGFAVALATSLGTDTAFIKFDGPVMVKNKSQITAKSNSYKGYVIMAGERGVMFWDAQLNNVKFLRSDNIVTIETPAP